MIPTSMTKITNMVDLETSALTIPEIGILAEVDEVATAVGPDSIVATNFLLVEAVMG
uniref:Uncharacterized protein n=1 Tax=Ciona savignyi TaxID=51511 RepID=H2ZID3_CIOSA